MAVKKEIWRGKTLEELQKMDIRTFAALVPSRERRKLVRGFTEQEKILIKRVTRGDLNIKTHCRDMVILPPMIGKSIKIYNGKEFVPFIVELDMLGHRLGEFSFTRTSVRHNAPGIGATRSSAAISVK